jgi:hypothetical protein
VRRWPGPSWRTDLRPEADHPERCNIVVDIDRVREVLLRIAADRSTRAPRTRGSRHVQTAWSQN